MSNDTLRAAQSGDIQFFKDHCVCQSTKINVLESSHPKSGDTVAHLAARHGHLEILTLLADEGFSLEIGNFDGKRPLHEAAQSAQYTCLEFLLSRKVTVDPLKRADWTPLMLACTKDNLKIIQKLIKHGASLQLKNKDGWNSFHVAVREGSLLIIKYLLETDPNTWNTTSKNGRTPLHTAALHGHEDVVLYLLESCGYMTDSQDSCGSTPLMDAVRTDSVPVARLLINSHQASVSLKDNLGRQCLHVAAQTGSVKCLRYLIEECSVNPAVVCPGRQASALHIAAKEGHRDVIEILLSKGVSVGLTDNKGRTALHVAAGAQHADCVHILLSHGAQCVPDKTGSTPQLLAQKPHVLKVFQEFDTG